MIGVIYLARHRTDVLGAMSIYLLATHKSFLKKVFARETIKRSLKWRHEKLSSGYLATVKYGEIETAKVNRDKFSESSK